MDYRKLRDLVFEAAKSCAKQGPGYSYQAAVLNRVAKDIGSFDSFVDSPRDATLEQEILTCWHDLFRLGYLSWGYDLDNPDAPFFHVPDPKRLQD